MLGERINQLVNTLGIKKGDFAERINFTQAYLSMMLSGKKENPSERFYDSVKREFNVNPDWLKTGKGDMFLVEEKDLTPIERALVQKFNSLTLSDQKIITNLVDSLSQKLQEQNSNK